MVNLSAYDSAMGLLFVFGNIMVFFSFLCTNTPTSS